RCSVYSQRPLSCADFPLGLLMDNSPQIKENYKGYRCLHNVRLNPGQEELEHELHEIMKDEARKDIEFLWDGKPRYAKISKVGDYFELAGHAYAAQMQRDPLCVSPRTERFSDAVMKMGNMQKDGQLQKGVQADLFECFLSPVVFALAEDYVANKMRHINEETLKFYEETTRRYKELRSI
ncbi:MAG: hypothetical protein QMD85_02575, partial [Candidatus Aenigmarchaeota archaeon]|nr:hypothetical protein [Candidatus Aenigmarchaeota archaeon]MDI6722423.1 hypothetical protein [Candidatus Aenigmarchaeota archaeon]